MAIRGEISDPWRRNPDRTDEPAMVTVTVEMEVLTSVAREGFDLLFQAADDFCKRPVDPPF